MSQESSRRCARMFVKGVGKVALARKPYRQSDLCNRNVPHSKERLRSLDPFLQDVPVGGRARRLLEATAEMTWAKIHQLCQVMKRQIAVKVGEHVVQQAAKLWCRKTALPRPHRRVNRRKSFPKAAS